MFHRLALSLAALGIVALFPACSSSLTESKIITTEAAQRPVLSADSLFFDQQLRAELTLGHGFYRKAKKGVFEARDDYSPFAQPGENDKKEERYQSLADHEEYFLPRMHNSTLPPYALRLSVVNLSQETVEVAYLGCDSRLGNFAIRPEKATLEAQKDHSPNAMITLLGVSGEDIPVKLTLSRNGKTETQTLTLRLVKDLPSQPAP